MPVTVTVSVTQTVSVAVVVTTDLGVSCSTLSVSHALGVSRSTLSVSPSSWSVCHVLLWVPPALLWAPHALLRVFVTLCAALHSSAPPLLYFSSNHQLMVVILSLSLGELKGWFSFSLGGEVAWVVRCVMFTCVCIYRLWLDD